jgi:23S rRNA (adenine2503-C2)-methyltransferase
LSFYSFGVMFRLKGEPKITCGKLLCALYNENAPVGMQHFFLLMEAAVRMDVHHRRPNVIGMNLTELSAMLESMGEPGYRAKQVFDWIYIHGVYDFNSMTNLPSALRDRLRSELRISLPDVEKAQIATDGTSKYLLRLDDGQHVESVLIPDTPRMTACLSSQVGCAIGCAFCATGIGGFVRNLLQGEIIGQLLVLQRIHGERLTNVVMMGMGEPLANYDQVMGALYLMNDRATMAMGARRFTISTAGLAPGIRKLASERLQVNLAISLHAPTDHLRDRLVPINRTFPLPQLMDACKEYIDTTRRRITFEYVLLSEVNDQVEHAHQLAKLVHGMLCHINLIPVNPVGESGFSRPSEQGTAEFARIVKGYGVEVTVRKEKGTGIDAACGQLRARQMR